MAFIIKSYDPVKTENGKIMKLASIQCDTTADLPTKAEIEAEGILIGSDVWIANEHKYRCLNSEKEWI